MAQVIYPSSRHFIEYLTGANLRETQQSTEVLNKTTTRNLRETQQSTEVALRGTATALRETQLSVELLTQPQTPLAVTPIFIEWQPPSVLLDEGREALCQRFYVDIDTGGEFLRLTILVDNVDYVYPLLIHTNGRQTLEIDYQISGRIYSIRLQGALTFGQVQWYQTWTDIETGEVAQ